MADQYEMNISLLSDAPPSEWQSGTLSIQIDSGTASGNLNLPNLYSNPIPFSSNEVSYNEMENSTFVTASGSNSQASLELGFFLMRNDYGIPVLYLGGMINLLDYEIREWQPYIINGSVQA